MSNRGFYTLWADRASRNVFPHNSGQPTAFVFSVLFLESAYRDRSMSSITGTVLKSQHLFDADEVPESESVTSEESSLVQSDEHEPKPFLVNFSSKRILTGTSSSEVRKEERSEDVIAMENRVASITSDDVLKEVKVQSSHRRMLSISPPGSKPTSVRSTKSIQDPKEDTEQPEGVC